ncbi:NUDIX domain-containing protein [Actinomadura chokoriensis]|uniref:NUDIX domain-containing protein n=1 Tax=Actinomadura chokoriensis TaxID=454156 RepID=A0ABV4R931_9ACTN
MTSQPRTYTHPDVLTTGVRGGWADPETDPTRIDWTTRQAAAAIPFPVVDGRPVNPCEKTGITRGRNELGHWGECQCADALVLARDIDGCLWALMIEREDGHGWAIPGGKVDPEDTDATAAAIRELAEETGLDIPGAHWTATAPRYVPDPRASDEAWMVTTLCVAYLGRIARDAFPAVAGADDARRAAWVRADSYPALTADLAETFGGHVFRAHVQMLKDAL